MRRLYKYLCIHASLTAVSPHHNAMRRCANKTRHLKWLMVASLVTNVALGLWFFTVFTQSASSGFATPTQQLGNVYYSARSSKSTIINF